MSTVAPDRRASAPPQPSLSEQPEREKSRSWSVLIVALIAPAAFATMPTTRRKAGAALSMHH